MIRTKHTVLCIDQDHFMLDVRRMVLERLGFKVSAASTHDAALNAFHAHRIDALVLSEFSELAKTEKLARAIKRLRPTIPILLLSSEAYPPENALDYIDAFLTKGESPDHLKLEITAMLRRSGADRMHKRALLWMGSAFATAAAWLLASTLKRRSRKIADQKRKPPASELQHSPRAAAAHV